MKFIVRPRGASLATLPPPKINLKRRANSRFHLNANPKIETEWFLDARTVIPGLEIPRNLVEQTNLPSWSLSYVLRISLSFSFSLVLVRLNEESRSWYFLSFFSKCPCFRRNLYSREDTLSTKNNFSIFESGQVSSYGDTFRSEWYRSPFRAIETFHTGFPDRLAWPTNGIIHTRENGFQRF